MSISCPMFVTTCQCSSTKRTRFSTRMDSSQNRGECLSICLTREVGGEGERERERVSE